VQLYRYFVSQSSEFFRYNSLCCFSTCVYCYCWLFRYDSVRKLLGTPSYDPSHNPEKLDFKTSPPWKTNILHIETHYFFFLPTLRSLKEGGTVFRMGSFDSALPLHWNVWYSSTSKVNGSLSSHRIWSSHNLLSYEYCRLYKGKKKRHLTNYHAMTYGEDEV
jgi:hypothetical protein